MFDNNNERFISSGKDFFSQEFNEILKERMKYDYEYALNKYMPIGSVVSLNNNDKYIMIIGFNYNSNGEVYDYIGCFYPYGITQNNNSIVFNHNQINKVYNIGFINSMEKDFKNNFGRGK